MSSGCLFWWVGQETGGSLFGMAFFDALLLSAPNGGFAEAPAYDKSTLGSRKTGVVARYADGTVVIRDDEWPIGLPFGDTPQPGPFRDTVRYETLIPGEPARLIAQYLGDESYYGALAQNTLRDKEPYPLSAAIVEVRKNPFHIQSAASTLLFPQARIGFSSLVWLVSTPEVDGTRSVGGVFVASLVAATVSDLAGLYLDICGVYAYDGGCGDAGSLARVAAVPVAVLGGAVGPKLAGARFGRAVFGSAAGVAAGVGVAELTGGLDNSLFLFVIPVVHAAITTVVTAFR